MGLAAIQRRRWLSLDANKPLYSRVPTRGDDGELLTDFMVLVSGLRTWSRARQESALNRMQAVLNDFQEVVFADLNVPLNLLWVSVSAKPGIIIEIYGELKTHIPETVLVGPYTPSR